MWGFGINFYFLRNAQEKAKSNFTRLDAEPLTPGSGINGNCIDFVDLYHGEGRGFNYMILLRKGVVAAKIIPKSALMTRETVMEDKKLCDAVNRHSSLSSAQILIVCLLYEMGKGKTSRWHPYLMHLPHTYDVLAMFGEFEKHALQVDEAMWVTEKAMLKAKSEWKEAHSLMQDLMFKPQFFTFKAWVWAAATISSRTLHIPWDEAGCLCPVGDLFNYDAPGIEPSGIEDLDQQLDSHSWRLTDGGFEEDANAYCFYAREHYKKGDQVLLCYGTYTNLELLEHYGFLLQENPNDKVFIPLEPALYSSTSWSKESLYIHHNGKPSFALLAALRLWATPQNRRRSVGHLVYSGSRVSTDNEIFIMKWLSKTCDAVLRNLPTSLEEDTLLLNAMDNSQDFSTFMEITKKASLMQQEVEAFAYCNFVRYYGYGFARESKSRWLHMAMWTLKKKRKQMHYIAYLNSQFLELSIGQL
ncbi:hypothetical protein JHK87_040714 [Glycine soja]|nr:hypothetical protein JHK87_040714 [Glycine soja]